jgi:hypothetical protein
MCREKSNPLDWDRDKYMSPLNWLIAYTTAIQIKANMFA